jgi:hypothetical protein
MVSTRNSLRVVKVDLKDLESELIYTAPLEELGEVETPIASIPTLPLNPLRRQYNPGVYSPGILGEREIREGIKTLRTCAVEHRKLWKIERQILLRFYNAEVHTHLSVNLPSFRQFLLANFDRITANAYVDQVAVGRKEELLKVPIGTYSLDDFKILERFRCFPSKGRGFGNQPDPVQIERLKECWKIACSKSSSLPTLPHIVEAVKEMGQKYPEYAVQKEISSVQKWRNKAIAAEARVVELEAEVEELKKKLLTISKES